MNAGEDTRALPDFASDATSELPTVEPESSSPLPDRLGSYTTYRCSGSFVSDSKCTRINSTDRLGSVVYVLVIRNRPCGSVLICS